LACYLALKMEAISYPEKAGISPNYTEECALYSDRCDNLISNTNDAFLPYINISQNKMNIIMAYDCGGAGDFMRHSRQTQWHWAWLFSTFLVFSPNNYHFTTALYSSINTS
jgi:hypothetical protein